MNSSKCKYAQLSKTASFTKNLRHSYLWQQNMQKIFIKGLSNKAEIILSWKFLFMLKIFFTEVNHINISCLKTSSSCGSFGRCENDKILKHFSKAHIIKMSKQCDTCLSLPVAKNGSFLNTKQKSRAKAKRLAFFCAYTFKKDVVWDDKDQRLSRKKKITFQ